MGRFAYVVRIGEVRASEERRELRCEAEEQRSPAGYRASTECSSIVALNLTPSDLNSHATHVHELALPSLSAFSTSDPFFLRSLFAFPGSTRSTAHQDDLVAYILAINPCHIYVHIKSLFSVFIRAILRS